MGFRAQGSSRSFEGFLPYATRLLAAFEGLRLVVVTAEKLFLPALSGTASVLGFGDWSDVRLALGIGTVWAFRVLGVDLDFGV